MSQIRPTHTSTVVRSGWRVSRTDESCQVHESVISHVWMSHITYEWVMSHTHLRGGEKRLTCVGLTAVDHGRPRRLKRRGRWRIGKKTHAQLLPTTDFYCLARGPWPVGHDSFTCDMTRWRVTWLVDVWHNSLTCDMTRWRVTWLVDVWHDSLTCDITRPNYSPL